ncbi:MAG TPA: hypothetical protein VNM14_03880 [Planctomycetota bacterium]|jgi:hypothetical protein|nr:hypothetical protein [Planctomycetota bacterium]
MKTMLCILALVGLSGCYYPSYAVRRVAPVDPPVTREEAERLASAGVSEPVVTELIEKRGAATLTPDDLVALKKAGVSDSLVQKMIASERKETAQVVVDDYYYAPGYYGYPYYPYYPSYGAYWGVGWGWGWGWGYHSYPRGSVGVRVYR